MAADNTRDFIQQVIENTPSDWLNLTTHRLDIFNENKAKTEFLTEFERLFLANKYSTTELKALPTAYDYIRLGHPLSCILEWLIAKTFHIKPQNVISFSSSVTPLLAILRKNLLENKKTRIVYKNEMILRIDVETIKAVYGYEFEFYKISDHRKLDSYNGSTIYISQQEILSDFSIEPGIDFNVNLNKYGSILLANGNDEYLSEIQHVRRRETIAMTPINCFNVLKTWSSNSTLESLPNKRIENKNAVLSCISEITQAHTQAVVGSSGLSVQYAIMMGLIHNAQVNHPGKAIKFVVPPNCYGGTNDQARRVAACLPHVEVIDLPVDGKNDMVRSLNMVLDQLALADTIPYIIAEIPTNPRVEVPDLQALEQALTTERITSTGDKAIRPVFILDQTFCPNVHFLGEGKVLNKVSAISYTSGSKFPSGGKCTAGYCVGNKLATDLMEKVALHMTICDNEATDLQYAYLAEQMPSMNERIKNAYSNTREFVNFIKQELPNAKINFVSDELAIQGFTPSVFSLDLPAKGSTHEERESYKRTLNHKLINRMISQIPDESKYCVSYGQLKGCYWTIPATSTQGTTKEGDKDYITRVALSGDLDLAKHKQIFKQFIKEDI